MDCDTTGFYQGLIDFPQYPSHCIEKIFQGGCLVDSISNPLALVLSSTIDYGWGGSFSFVNPDNYDLLATLAKTHNVCHRSLQGPSELNDLERLGHQKKIDVLVKRAHGSSIAQQYEKEPMSTLTPRKYFAQLMSSLTPNATIILQSCLNAATCGEGDFAGFICSMAPPQATIYAATRSFAQIKIQSGIPPVARMFTTSGIDVTYRSGAGGYCNNPLQPDDLRKEELDRLHLLVWHGLAYETALSAATEAFKSADLKTHVIDLLEILVDKGQGYEVAINIALEAFKDTDYLTTIGAIDLIGMLVDQSQGYEVAISIAIEAFKTLDDIRTRIKAIALFEKLFDKGQGYEVAITSATEACKSTDDSNHYLFGLQLFGKLVDRDQGYEAALAALNTATEEDSQSAEISFRAEAATLRQKLVAKGQRCNKGCDSRSNEKRGKTTQPAPQPANTPAAQKKDPDANEAFAQSKPDLTAGKTPSAKPNPTPPNQPQTNTGSSTDWLLGVGIIGGGAGIAGLYAWHQSKKRNLQKVR